MANLAVSQQRSEVGKLLRFMVVGLSGTLLDFALLTLFKEVFLLTTLAASTLAFSAGVANNFTWNRYWTFADTKSDNATRQFVQFALISAVGLMLNNMIILLLENPLDAVLSGGGYGYLLAKVMATGIVFLWNFTMNRYWTFSVNEGIRS